MALAAGASCPAIPTAAHLGRAPPSPQPLLPPQVCGEKNRFEKLMEYFRNEDSNIDFMVSGGGGWGPRCAPCPMLGWRHLGTHSLLPWWQLPWSPQACPWLCPKGCQVPKMPCPQKLLVPPQGVVSQGLLSSWLFPRSRVHRAVKPPCGPWVVPRDLRPQGC